MARGKRRNRRGAKARALIPLLRPVQGSPWDGAKLGFMREIHTGLLLRTATIIRDSTIFDKDGEDGEETRAISFSFSSEDPYERYFGIEILGHKKGEVRLDRLNDGGAFLKDHNTRTQIGVVDQAWVDADSGMGRVDARFGRSALAEEERVDVRDGIRTKISVGYLVHEMVLESEKEGLDTYRVTDWEPLEVSTVAIPADATVGVGREDILPALAARSAEFANHRTRVVIPAVAGRGKTVKIKAIRKSDGVLLVIEERDFDDEIHDRWEDDDAAVSSAATVPVRVTESSDEIVAKAVARAQKVERERVRKLSELGTKYNASDRASKAIEEGRTFEELRWELFEAGYTPASGSQPSAGTRSYPTLETDPNRLDLSQKDSMRYSLMRMIRSHIEKNPEVAPFEHECSRQIEEACGQSPRGFYYPRDLLDIPLNPTNDRTVADKLADLVRVIGTATQGGGSVVATDLLAASFIDLLRNQSVVMSMGATFIPGLVGDVDIPRQSATGTAGWLAEGGSATFQELTLDTVQLRPKTIAAKSKITRRLMLQSTPAIEGLVRADLAIGIALGIDLGAVQGTGASNQPTGITNMAGVSVVSLGTNAGPMTWVAQVDLVAQVKLVNAFLGNMGFVTTAAAWGHMMVVERAAGTAIFILQEPGDNSLGRRLMASEQVPSNLTKGTHTGPDLSAEIYGNWSDLLIGEWGTLDLFPDPFTDGDEGAVILRAFQDADVQARHEESFSVILDMDTA